jgi:hypothetical protein
MTPKECMVILNRASWRGGLDDIVPGLDEAVCFASVVMEKIWRDEEIAGGGV